MKFQSRRLSVKGVDLGNFLKDRTVIIFGAGIAGKGVLKIFSRKKIPVAGFFDNGAVIPYSVDNIPVSKMDFATLDSSEVVFVLTIRNVDEAVKQLNEAGGFDWFPAYELLDEENKKILSQMELQKLEAAHFYYEKFLNKNLLTLDSLDFVITENCSLRCKECSNLMQYYAKPKNFPVDKLKTELDSICDVLDEIHEIRLIGGEPFIHPNWNEFLQYVSTKKNVRRICFYTNGTILPIDSQLDTLKETGAWLSISNYHELSRKLENLKVKLDAHAVPYEVKEIPYWTKCSTFKKHNRTPQELLTVFERCCARNLATLLNGRLYACPFISNAMNLCAIPQDENDFVDLNANVDVEILRQRVRKLFNRPFFNSCAWCTGRPTPEDIRDEDKIPPHEQTNKPLRYKKYLANATKLHKLAVIVPVYNVEKYLKKCVDSIRNQTFSDFHLILVDDGSTDNSLAICEEYAKLDDRISVISQDNHGPAAARNVALDLTRGGGWKPAVYHVH